MEYSREYNKALCERFPWLIARTREDVPIEGCELTLLDDMPRGWRIAFGEEMCERIQAVLEKGNFVNEYRITQIKEKFGGLRWYDNGGPIEIYDELQDIIEEYEEKSFLICAVCGAPATKVSQGWYYPFCDECAKNVQWTENFIDIKEFYKEI